MTTKKERTRWSRRYTAKQVRNFLDACHPDLLADHFDADVFEEYLGWLHEQPYAPQTIEQALIGARTMLKWAETANFISKAPPKPKFRVPPSEVRIIASDDYRKVVLAAASGDEPVRLTLLLRLLWQTGMRPSEAWGFRKCQIQVGQALLQLRPHGDYTLKTEISQRAVPLSRELVMELVTLPTKTDGTIFGVPEVNRPYHYWRHRLQKAIAATDVEPFTLGDFRHTRSTRLLEWGTPLHVYGRMMGHSPKTALTHYAKVSERALRVAFDKASHHADEDFE